MALTRLNIIEIVEALVKKRAFRPWVPHLPRESWLKLKRNSIIRKVLETSGDALVGLVVTRLVMDLMEDEPEDLRDLVNTVLKENEVFYALLEGCKYTLPTVYRKAAGNALETILAAWFELEDVTRATVAGWAEDNFSLVTIAIIDFSRGGADPRVESYKPQITNPPRSSTRATPDARDNHHPASPPRRLPLLGVNSHLLPPRPHSPSPPRPNNRLSSSVHRDLKRRLSPTSPRERKRPHSAAPDTSPRSARFHEQAVEEVARGRRPSRDRDGATAGESRRRAEDDDGASRERGRSGQRTLDPSRWNGRGRSARDRTTSPYRPDDLEEGEIAEGEEEDGEAH
ncbi:hypothetical protein C8R46DRAFT_180149 [Mycena filopes]|nr:hypothetical protein C8R46DRAFT_180149 [Mycena filopes]